jgi:hypothetical protein
MSAYRILLINFPNKFSLLREGYDMNIVLIYV